MGTVMMLSEIFMPGYCASLSMPWWYLVLPAANAWYSWLLRPTKSATSTGDSVCVDSSGLG